MKIELPELKEGEHIIGIMPTKEGLPDYWLIDAPIPDTGVSWKEFSKWARKLGYCQASEQEGRLMATNPYPGLPTSGAFWLGEYESGSDYALIQNFDSGNQYCYGKDLKFRARAVRRVPIKGEV